mmetsp:Transcript_7130/g.10866  ORF Transcript_7130/g.10866 Transcript_7130/m.10866 type:complete len:136 (+) Transcript_7130:40-447(+)|eukprot:CAMPEP_0201553210 /NCGR_PEP_ID=MMETSP0173_2-20130828/19507_1 /ASSEMBLY_ACC=CAM_ASM_000268 /TAXON_ID=218659 /ORGANISM="Vexillifera sp., Strain DIVA3 564/2" /LENGTH=135 /DNA_ID=CAMNT_0047963837 /DNA_START=18 /DNA_END=425 /DNA_ORIENTATION=+
MASQQTKQNPLETAKIVVEFSGGKFDDKAPLESILAFMQNRDALSKKTLWVNFLNLVFDHLDNDGNGSLEVEEIRKNASFFQSILADDDDDKPMTADDAVGEFLALADSNDDGVVSKSEWTESWEQLLDLDDDDE